MVTGDRKGIRPVKGHAPTIPKKVTFGERIYTV